MSPIATTFRSIFNRKAASAWEPRTLGIRQPYDSPLPELITDIQSRSGEQFALMLISVDHLAEINSAFGYVAGDEILPVIEGRLRRHTPFDMICVPLSGADFAVLRPAPGGPSTVKRDVLALLRAVSGPVTVGGTPMPVGLSAGSALCPLHARTGPELIRCAVDALRRSRECQSEAEVYDPLLDSCRAFGPDLVSDLLRALTKNQFVLYYQPKVTITTGAPTEVKAIPRWNHPRHGMIGPEVILPLATRMGLTRQVTRILLSSAVFQCAAWRRQGIGLGVRVGLSTGDVLDAQLPYALTKTINSAGLGPEALTLELSEEAFRVDRQRASQVFMQLHSFGIRLCLSQCDQSSLPMARLRELPFDELKLDGSLANMVQAGAQEAAIVRSIVSLAKSLSIHTVAADVLEKEQLGALASCECDSAQGLVYGEDLGPSEMTAWFNRLAPRIGAHANVAYDGLAGDPGGLESRERTVTVARSRLAELTRRLEQMVGDQKSFAALSTRILLRTGVNLSSPDSGYAIDPGSVSRVEATIAEMGYRLWG